MLYRIVIGFISRKEYLLLVRDAFLNIGIDFLGYIIAESKDSSIAKEFRMLISLRKLIY